MSVEVVEADFLVVPLKNGSEGNSPRSPFLHEKDAVDQCPEPKRIHHFYFIKYPSYEDPKLKSKIDQADEDLQKKTEAWFEITVAIKAKQEVLLSKQIRDLHFQTQHGSNTLVEENQLLREIRQLEGTREEVIANDIAFKKDTYGWTWKTIRDPVKATNMDLDKIRKEKHLLNARIQYLKRQVKVLDNELISLDVKLTASNKRRFAAYEVFFELKRERDQGNAYYYQNRSLLKKATMLSAEKNVAALEELSHRKVEEFMSQWSSSKAFRDVYTKRILPSLISRKLSQDGRMMNPDGRPLVSEFSSARELEAVTKRNSKKFTQSESTVMDGDGLSNSSEGSYKGPKRC